MKQSAADRFFSRVDFGENVHGGTRCLLWRTSGNYGYGRFVLGHQHQKATGSTAAHRWLYERWVGPIPDGLELDHLCHDPYTCLAGTACPHRRCVNPAHLALVTPEENKARSSKRVVTHCPRGHEYDEANTYISKKGCRCCRACARERYHERKMRR